MYMITKVGNKIFAKKIESIMSDSDAIYTFLEEGSPVILVDEVESIDELGLDYTTIEYV